MNKKLEDPGSDLDLGPCREQGFFDKSREVRYLIGLGFTLCLFLFLHFREVRVEILELNTVAPKYVVAQIDFSFFDEQATYLMRREAVRDIGKIFLIDENNVRQLRSDFEKNLLGDQKWREEIPDITFDELYRGIDLLEKTLIGVRFTDPRTEKKFEEVGLQTENYFIFTPVSIEEPIPLPLLIWASIKARAFEGATIQPGAITFIIDYFNDKPLKIDEDINAQLLLSKRVQAKIPDKFTKVSAGNRIIDQGEKVTNRHIAMLQAMKRALSDSRNLWHPLTLLGSFLMAILLTLISGGYLYVNQPQVYYSNRQLFLLVTILVLTMALSKIVEFFVISSQSNLIEMVRYPLLVPFAAILLCTLMNPTLAAFASTFLAVILTMTLPFERQGFLVINLSTALIAILTSHGMEKRKEIFMVCVKSWICCAILILSINFYDNTFRQFSMIADLSSTAMFMMMTAVLVVGLLPLLESGFNVMTNVTLMEYMDPNHPLLRRMTIEAPGTYQHSIVVGNLAEAAASAIRANGLFCRIATLFHDVGKMVTPQYFTENQQNDMNIHQLLTPQESAQVIMAHVSEGVALARKAGLPERFIDIIKEHHGTTLVYYFYRKALELVDNDKSQVNVKDFRYAGPRPQTKESAIIMIADTLEAASRSLEEINEDTIGELVTKLVRIKADDGQFDECSLTFEELAIVKRSMIKTLVAARHSRIKYPEREIKQENVQIENRAAF